MTPRPDAMSRNQGHRLTFRADIQGLRAVAILLVVAAHARLRGWAGGFVGVDVFFVLSGYLITALLVEEIRGSGQLAFARFYVRRLRRLLPGLFLMLSTVALLAWLLVPALDQSRQSASATNAAGWISNIYFALLQVGYFSPTSASNLFLHTWSLGVEEQFYLAWPMLAVLTLTGLKRGCDSSSASRMLWALVLVGIGSLALCLYWSYHTPELAFYMMPARAWQFALGALVYMLYGVSSAPSARENPSRFQLRASWGWIGLALILGSALLLDGTTTYPGFWALVPSTGAAMTIAAGVNKPHASFARLLSLRPMRWIGQVSYSWYLWHWPILLLGIVTLGFSSLADRLLLAGLSLVVAAASHGLVERPIRHARWTLSRPRLSLAAAAGIVFLGMLGGQFWDHSAAARLHEPALQRLKVAKTDTPLIYLQGCDSWYMKSSVKPCVYGPKDARHTAVFIGDSIAMQWFPALREIMKKRDWRLIVLTKSSCPMVDEPFYYARIKRVFARCTTWRDHALALLPDYRPDLTILGSTYTYPFSRNQWIDGTRKILAIASRYSGKVYLLRSTPSLPFNGPDCLAPHSDLYRWLSQYPTCSFPAHNRDFDRVYAWRRQAAKPFANVSTIDMTSSVCPADTCRAKRDGQVVYRDDQHMTASFARSLAPQLAAKIERPPSPNRRHPHHVSASTPN